jgi:hypothetical protein
VAAEILYNVASKAHFPSNMKLVSACVTQCNTPTSAFRMGLLFGGLRYIK